MEATLNPLELLRKEFEEKTGFNVQSVQDEINRLEQVRLELEENLNERRELYNTFFSDIEASDGSFTNMYLKRVKERENVTVESINALIKKYNELEQMQQRINQKISFPTESLSEQNEKIQGYSQGGFTGGRIGIVHPNEWVAPSWMVGQLRGVFDQLESRRLSGSRVPVSSVSHNNRNFNVTINNHTPDEANLYRNMHYLRWMSRYS